MDKKEKNVIEIVNDNITRFACELGYSYLNAGYSKWENNSGETLKLNSMKGDYLQNCVSFIERGIEELESEDMDAEIKDLVIPFVRKHDEDRVLKGKHLKATELIVKNVRGSIIEELQEKKRELETYL
jgi:hypothetical protein